MERKGAEFRGAAGRTILALSTPLVNRIVLAAVRISTLLLPVYRQHAMFLEYLSVNI
jgi:hypothetical protein